MRTATKRGVRGKVLLRLWTTAISKAILPPMLVDRSFVKRDIFRSRLTEAFYYLIKIDESHRCISASSIQQHQENVVCDSTYSNAGVELIRNPRRRMK